ncbi:Carbonic anhydrase-related protein 10 [Nymphon striatum]|nr:Carbonic anhydrase-related protein 10 [Nymphon striatum]
MEVSRDLSLEESQVIDGMPIQVTTSFKYLGSVVTSDGRITEELNCRLGAANRCLRSLDDIMRKKRIQLYGYNNALYKNMSQATRNVQGLVVVSVMLQIGELSNPELRLLTTHLDKIRYKGQSHPVRHISIHTLLPETDDFMTYDGSTTSPGCYETVSWIIMNKPIYITRQQLHSLRKLMVGTRVHQKAPLGDNYRPPMPVNHRTIRTNIDFSKNKDNVCPTMKSKRLYKGEFDKQTN